MNILAILIPVSLILGGFGLWAFLWTVRSEQYDDSAGNAARILVDDLPQMARAIDATGDVAPIDRSQSVKEWAQS